MAHLQNKKRKRQKPSSLTFEERNKNLIGNGDFQYQYTNAQPIWPAIGKPEFIHRSRGLKHIRAKLEEIIEASTDIDYHYNGEDEYAYEFIRSGTAAENIFRFLLKSKLLK